MKPLRFLISFFSSYLLSFGFSLLFISAVVLFGDIRYLLMSALFTILLVFLFSYIYFKGVRHLNWRQRFEVIIVWFGLILLIDYGVLTILFKKSISDLTVFSLSAYGLVFLSLFVTAYLTSDEHPRFSKSGLGDGAIKGASK